MRESNDAKVVQRQVSQPCSMEIKHTRTLLKNNRRRAVVIQRLSQNIHFVAHSTVPTSNVFAGFLETFHSATCLRASGPNW